MIIVGVGAGGSGDGAAACRARARAGRRTRCSSTRRATRVTRPARAASSRRRARCWRRSVCRSTCRRRGSTARRWRSPAPLARRSPATISAGWCAGASSTPASPGRRATAASSCARTPRVSRRRARRRGRARRDRVGERSGRRWWSGADGSGSLVRRALVAADAGRRRARGHVRRAGGGHALGRTHRAALRFRLPRRACDGVRGYALGVPVLDRRRRARERRRVRAAAGVRRGAAARAGARAAPTSARGPPRWQAFPIRTLRAGRAGRGAAARSSSATPRASIP